MQYDVVCSMNWIQVAQDRVHEKVPCVNMLKNTCFTNEAGKF